MWCGYWVAVHRLFTLFPAEDGMRRPARSAQLISGAEVSGSLTGEDSFILSPAGTHKKRRVQASTDEGVML